MTSVFRLLVVDDDGPAPTRVLRLLKHTNQIDNGSSIGRSLSLGPVGVLEVADDPTLVDLGVGDGKLPHDVAGELADASLLNEHVAMLSHLLCWPVAHTLLLQTDKQTAVSDKQTAVADRQIAVSETDSFRQTNRDSRGR